LPSGLVGSNPTTLTRFRLLDFHRPFPTKGA